MWKFYAKKRLRVVGFVALVLVLGGLFVSIVFLWRNLDLTLQKQQHVESRLSSMGTWLEDLQGSKQSDRQTSISRQKGTNRRARRQNQQLGTPRNNRIVAGGGTCGFEDQRKQGQMVPVYLWPQAGRLSARYFHIFKDGIDQSPYLQLVTDWKTEPSALWIVDLGYGNASMHALEQAAKERTQQWQGTQHPQQDPWRVVLVDYGDDPVSRSFWNQAIELMGANASNVVVYLRSIAQRRVWSNRLDWVQVGIPLPQKRRGKRRASTFVPYYSAPFPVRTDTIVQLQMYLRIAHQQELSFPIERNWTRSVDVTHLWPLRQDTQSQNGSSTGIKHGSGGVNRKSLIRANLRFAVSQLIDDWGQKYAWKTFVGLAGSQIARTGRTMASSFDYLQAMMSTKIMVVTQRDGWEDHYRLMEALAASGACVFTDYMHGLPAGLENRTSIVVFSSRNELHSLLQYYLKHDEERMDIAKNGRWIAMTRHRSWHRMEEMVFFVAISSPIVRLTMSRLFQRTNVHTHRRNVPGR